jgi:hypothetical protein
MLENLCLNKIKNKSAKFSENLNALSIVIKTDHDIVMVI